MNEPKQAEGVTARAEETLEEKTRREIRERNARRAQKVLAFKNVTATVDNEGTLTFTFDQEARCTRQEKDLTDEEIKSLFMSLFPRPLVQGEIKVVREE